MNELLAEFNEKAKYLDEGELYMVTSYMSFLLDQKSKRLLAESMAAIANMEEDPVDADIVDMEAFRRKKLG